jgi:hypothetical protein
MANLKPHHYRLLAGPYRIAVWSKLSLFKTELVTGLVTDLLEHDASVRSAAASAALAKVRDARELLTTQRESHLALLAASMQRVSGEAGNDIRLLADRRVGQLEEYLEDLLHLWSAAADSPDPANLVLAISQLIWPYYCVVYPRPGRSGDEANGYNFCTWIADSKLLESSSLPEVARHGWAHSTRTKPKRKLRLIPSLDACFDGDNSGALRDLIDRASEQLLDFEAVENNLGHVQELLQPFEKFVRDTGIITKLTNGVTDPSNESQIETALAKATAAFTDLFQLTGHALRYVLSERAMTGADNVTPLGVLFLASPSLPAVEDIIRPTTHQLSALLDSAWKAAGGHAFTRAFHGDFASLLDQFREIDRSNKAELAGELSHHSKNILNNINSLLRLAQDRHGPLQKELLRIAEHNARYMGLEFGLTDRIRGALRVGDETRAILAGIPSRELADLVERQIRMLLIIRSGADLGFGREYSLNGTAISTKHDRIDAAENEMRDALAGVYEARGSAGDREHGRMLRNSTDWSPHSDPIGLTLFFLCRELIDNMRPRFSDSGDKLDVRFTPILENQDSRWRGFEFLQILDGCDDPSPFRQARQAGSLLRFNDFHRDGPGGTGLAQILCDEPIIGVSPRQHLMRQVLLLPA